MPNILITFAHPLEAAPTIKTLDAKPIEDHLYTFAHGRILITGMGPDNAAAQTAAHAPGHDEVWNLGLAGALNPSLEVGSIHEIGSLSRKDHPTVHLGPGAHLFTSPTPVWGKTLDTPATLVDMEGYAVATAHTLPTKMWKIVSDHTESGGSALLKERLTTLAAQLSTHLLQQLRSISGQSKYF